MIYHIGSNIFVITVNNWYLCQWRNKNFFFSDRAFLQSEKQTFVRTIQDFLNIMEERGSSKLILRRYLGCKAHFSQVSNYVRGSLSRCSTKSLVARELFFSVPRCKMATIGLGSSHNCFCAGDLMFALGPCWFVWLSRNNLSGFGFSVVAYMTIFITGRKNGFAQSRKKIWAKLVNATFACFFF